MQRGTKPPCTCWRIHHGTRERARLFGGGDIRYQDDIGAKVQASPERRQIMAEQSDHGECVGGGEHSQRLQQIRVGEYAVLAIEKEEVIAADASHFSERWVGLRLHEAYERFVRDKAVLQGSSAFHGVVRSN